MDRDVAKYLAKFWFIVAVNNRRIVTVIVTLASEVTI